MGNMVADGNGAIRYFVCDVRFFAKFTKKQLIFLSCIMNTGKVPKK
jgi:hypothetical protein